MTQEESDRKTVISMLNSEQGEALIRHLKRDVGFDLPVFSTHDESGHKARLIDGGRQLVCRILNLKSEGEENEKEKQK